MYVLKSYLNIFRICIGSHLSPSGLYKRKHGIGMCMNIFPKLVPKKWFIKETCCKVKWKGV